MNTINQEVARIRCEVANLASCALTGKTIEERVKELFSEISPEEYKASEQVWDELYLKRVTLQDELDRINRQIEAVEKIIQRPIKNS